MVPSAPAGPLVLNQKYELGRQLGAGGMGAVYWARHLVLQREVAVKVLTPELMSSRSAVERFLREARALAAVDHPGVCHIFDADTDPAGVPFLVMELLEGETLDAVVRSSPQTPLQERVAWIIKAAEGLGAAHGRGIVHRDVKPSNLMLTPGGVKVLDFGVAKAAFDHTRELTGDNAVGTTQYMSPEQLMGEPVDPRTDVWALAVTLYRLLSGKLPFEGATPVAYMRAVMDGAVVPLSARGVDVPAGIWSALEHALRPLEQRTPTVEQFAAQLSMAQPVSAPIEAPPASSSVPVPVPVPVPAVPSKPTSGRRVTVGVAAVLIGVGFTWWMLWSPAPAEPALPAVASPARVVVAPPVPEPAAPVVVASPASTPMSEPSTPAPMPEPAAPVPVVVAPPVPPRVARTPVVGAPPVPEPAARGPVAVPTTAPAKTPPARTPPTETPPTVTPPAETPPAEPQNPDRL